MIFADAFHVAKFLIKHEAYSQGYDVGFVPTDGHSTNELEIEIENLEI